MSRVERYYSWDRAARWVKIHTRRRRVSKGEVVNVDTSVDSSLEMDICHNKGHGYAPQVFVDPEFAATVPHTEPEESDAEIVEYDFIGDYYKKCINLKLNRCTFDGADWDEDLMVVELPKSSTTNQDTKSPTTNQEPTPATNQDPKDPTSNPDINIDITKHIFGLMSTSTRQPPPGLSEFRNNSTTTKTANAQETNEYKTNKKATDTFDIEGVRSITNEEFESM